MSLVSLLMFSLSQERRGEGDEVVLRPSVKPSQRISTIVKVYFINVRSCRKHKCELPPGLQFILH